MLEGVFLPECFGSLREEEEIMVGLRELLVAFRTKPKGDLMLASLGGVGGQRKLCLVPGCKSTRAED